MYEPVVCLPKRLPREQWVSAAQIATNVNPMNHPPIHRLSLVHKNFVPTPESIAVLTTKFWRTNGVRLTVRFMDNPPGVLGSRILSHMNAWGKTANIKFVTSSTDPQVRITRTPRSGHWSYVGTDILSVPADQPTMNLDSFSLNTPNLEFYRVVRHEAGHTLGCPHEHLRASLVALIDEQKAIKYYKETQGWDEAKVRRQVLTPFEESSIRGTEDADPKSIMCYQIPGKVTKDGKPILGGKDIDKSDYAFIAVIYPKTISPVSAPQARASRKKGTRKTATGKSMKSAKRKT